MSDRFGFPEPTEYAGGMILAARDQGIGLITFNHPERLNAMTLEMWLGLEEVLDEYAADPTLRVLIFRGAGDRAFISGGDISTFKDQRGDADAVRRSNERRAGARRKLANFPKPTIAAIRGYCLGGGLGIALMMDLRIASEESRFGIPAARLSIAYGFDGLQTLVSLVGPANARMIMYTARRFPAADAARMGLINEAVPDADLEATVLALAREIGANAPLSIGVSKFGITEALKDPADRDLDALGRLSRECFDSADYKEGSAAFMGKRPPVFLGR